VCFLGYSKEFKAYILLEWENIDIVDKKKVMFNGQRGIWMLFIA
jgi:hypothetical protein